MLGSPKMPVKPDYRWHARLSLLTERQSGVARVSVRTRQLGRFCAFLFGKDSCQGSLGDIDREHTGTQDERLGSGCICVMSEIRPYPT